jgi:threo-3-hydroxy-L-aspartate ammonia-lyase
MVGLDDVRAAARRLGPVAHRTPVLTSRALDERTGTHALLKAEVLQRTGSFKFRGAYNKLAALSAAERERGLIAFSSGNHAQAVALAASLFGAHATIVMPADTPAMKLAATRDYGGEIVTYDRYTQDREMVAAELQAQRGLTLVAPFDDPFVIAGQGSAALELIDDAGGVDVLLAPVGGGGLVAGCAITVKALSGEARVFGVEPEQGDDLRRSLDAGERVTIEVPRTIADALQATSPGELTFSINRLLLDGVLTVSDAELLEAMRFAIERLKLVVEPGGAAALAALLAGKVPAGPDDRVGVILSGGNIDPARLAALIGAD